MIFCSQCGGGNSDSSNFCMSCGRSLNFSEEMPGNQSGAGYRPVPSSQSSSNNEVVFAILGWIFTAISTLFFPPLFGGGGVICGYLHRKSNMTHGTIIMISAVACGVFGILLGMGVDEYRYHL